MVVPVEWIGIFIFEDFCTGGMVGADLDGEGEEI